MIDVETALLRLGLALLFGFVVGVEREWRHKAAGLKTNTLVALGAAGFALVTDTFGPGNHNPAQIAAAVVSGIGFIGAGVIMHRGPTIQGVTTAATLWANASMSVSIGLGHYAVALFLLIGVIVAQFAVRFVESGIARIRRYELIAPAEIMQLVVECDPASLPAVDAALPPLTPLRRTVRRFAGRLVLELTYETAPDVERSLLEIAGVSRVETRIEGEPEEDTNSA